MRWEAIINWTQQSTSCDGFNVQELAIERPWLKTWDFIAVSLQKDETWHDIQPRCESIGAVPYPNSSPPVWIDYDHIDEEIFPDLQVESITPGYWIAMGRWWRPHDNYYYVLGFSRERDAGVYHMAWP